MTSSERMADHIAGVLMGLLLASLSAAAMGWIWRDMWLPVFIIFLVFWGFTSIDTIILQRHNLVQTSLSAWEYMKPSEIGKRAMSLTPSERIWGDIATILLGIIFGLFVGGLIGKLWPVFRWPVFFVASFLWIAVVVTAIAAGRRDNRETNRESDLKV